MNQQGQPPSAPSAIPSSVRDTAAWQVAAMMRTRTAARDWVRYGLDADACEQRLAEIEADGQALESSGTQWLMRLAQSLLHWADESDAEARRYNLALVQSTSVLDHRRIDTQIVPGLSHETLLTVMDAQRERSGLVHAKYLCLKQAAQLRAATAMATGCVDAGASTAVLMLAFEHAMAVHRSAAQALEDVIECACRFEHDLSNAEDALDPRRQLAASTTSAASPSARVAATAVRADSGADNRVVSSGVGVAAVAIGLAGTAHVASSDAPGMSVNPANGLPMIDDVVDIHGNAFGTDSIDDAFAPIDHAADYATFADRDIFPSTAFDAGLASGGHAGIGDEF